MVPGVGQVAWAPFSHEVASVMGWMAVGVAAISCGRGPMCLGWIRGALLMSQHLTHFYNCHYHCSYHYYYPYYRRLARAGQRGVSDGRLLLVLV